jgi:hypothetical protein
MLAIVAVNASPVYILKYAVLANHRIRNYGVMHDLLKRSELFMAIAEAKRRCYTGI